MKHLTILGAVFFLCCIWACKKDKHHTITNGRITDSRTGKPVPYAKALLVAMDFSGWIVGQKVEAVKQANANGAFAFDFLDVKYSFGVINNRKMKKAAYY